VIPAGLQAFVGRFWIVPVSVEDVCPADQQFSGLAIGNISTIFADQPDLGLFHDPNDRPGLQTESQGSDRLRRPP
jgi:hypothetical protein